MLRRIDVLRAKEVTGEKFNLGIIEADTKYLFPNNSKNLAEDQKRDVISHCVLRMAYCKTEELRRWLLTNETQLFTIRLGNARSSDVGLFLKENGIKYPPVSYLIRYMLL